MNRPSPSLLGSVVMHVALIGFGLVSLSSPRPMAMADVEALPVDIVPIEDVARSVKGDKKAPASEKPAPLPTKRPETTPDAQEVGDNDIDSKKPPVPDQKPTPVESAEAPKKQPEPIDKIKPEEVQKPLEKPQPVPATEVAPTPTPKQDVQPEPVKDTPVPLPKPAEKVAEAEPAKPDEVAAAIAREEEAAKEAEAKAVEQAAKVAEEKKAAEAKKAAEEKKEAEAKAAAAAKAQTAKNAERKKAEKAIKEAASRAKSDETGSIEDEVAALLSKAKPSGGGAKRSDQQAALGGKKTTGGKLSNSEEGALKEQFQRCWNVPVGMEGDSGLKVTIDAKFTPDGKLEGRPEVSKSSGNQIFDESARRAVMKCDREGVQFPTGKHDIWGHTELVFDPRDMIY